MIKNIYSTLILLFFSIQTIVAKDDLNNKNQISEIKCIKLTQIDLDENEILNKSAQKELFSKYLNNCIDNSLIQKILNSISSYYIDLGFITTKPYLKKQIIADGQIDIFILKGKIGRIIHKETKKSSSKISTAFIGQKGEILNLRNLETSLESMNRVNSSDSSFKIIPSKKVGSSIVEIETKQSFPLHLSLGISGEKQIQRDNSNLTGILTYDNPLNINDILKYTYNGARLEKEYQSSKGKELNYSFPIGSYLLELIGSEFLYNQGVQGVNQSYTSKGKTKSARVQLSKVISRNQTNKLEFKLSLYHKNTKNYFEDALLDVSSYKTTLLQAELIHTNYQNWGQLYSVYSIYRGTDFLGARSDSYYKNEEDPSGEKLQFTKYSMDNTLYYLFSDKSYNFSSNFHAQYTKDLLYRNDQLTVGSKYTVRGYDDSNYYGNSGWYFKNDLIKTFPLNFNENIIKDISIFVGLDAGYVKCESNNTDSCGNIYGKAIGFSTNSKKLKTNFTWSRPIKVLSENFKKNTLFNFNIEFNF